VVGDEKIALEERLLAAESSSRRAESKVELQRQAADRELADIQASSGDAERHRDEAVTENAKLTTQLEDLNAEYKRLNIELEEKNRDALEAAKTQSSLRNKIELLETSLLALTTRGRELETELETLKLSSSANVTRIQSLESQIQDLTNERSEQKQLLDKTNEEKESSIKEAAELVVKIKSMNDLIAALEDRTAGGQRDTEKVSVMLAAARDEQTRVERERDEWMAKSEQANKLAADTQLALDDAKACLEEVQRTGGSQSEEIKRLLIVESDAKTAAMAAEQTSDHLKAASALLAEVSLARSTLEQELTETKDKLAHEIKQKEDAEAEVDRLKGDANGHEEKVHELTDEATKRKADIARLTAELDELKSSHSNATLSVAEQKEQIEVQAKAKRLTAAQLAQAK
jgi:chromosome segregation ATPase